MKPTHRISKSDQWSFRRVATLWPICLSIPPLEGGHRNTFSLTLMTECFQCCRMQSSCPTDAQKDIKISISLRSHRISVITLILSTESLDFFHAIYFPISFHLVAITSFCQAITIIIIMIIIFFWYGHTALSISPFFSIIRISITKGASTVSPPG